MTSALARLTRPGARARRRDLLKGETCQLGGFSSPASQPTASVFKGSMGKETSSVRWHVLHSKVRRSNPRSPGEIRARPILCLQVGHIGRSTVGNELRISLHPGQAYAFPHSGARFCLAAAQYAFNGPSAFTRRRRARLSRQPNVSSAAPQARGRASPRPTAKGIETGQRRRPPPAHRVTAGLSPP